MSPPPTAGRGSILVAGDNRGAFCEFSFAAEALLWVAVFCKKDEKILAVASIG